MEWGEKWTQESAHAVAVGTLLTTTLEGNIQLIILSQDNFSNMEQQISSQST